MKMADVIHLNYLLLSVIKRFGINLGFGEKTIEDLCVENNINIDFFLEIANAFNDKNYSPDNTEKDFPLKNVIHYLQKTHYSYLNNTIPEIQEQITMLGSSGDEKNNNFKILKTFFDHYHNELKIHITREEEKVFPYVIELDAALAKGIISDELYQKMMSYSIDDYYDEHDDIEEKLYDLKNIIIKYLPQQDNTELISKLISNLFMLEKDMNDHSRIEDKVLVPKVSEIEKKLLSIYKKENGN